MKTRFCRIGLVVALVCLLPMLSASGKSSKSTPKKSTSKPHVSYPTYHGTRGVPGLHTKGKHAAGKSMDVVMQADDGVQVRLSNPPVEYDEKGNIKQPTKAELDELKGPDKTLPGYTGDYDGLGKGQTVIVYLSRKLPPKSDSLKDKSTDDKPALKATDDKAAVDKPAVKAADDKAAAKPAGDKAADKPDDKDATKDGAKADKPRWTYLTRVGGTLEAINGSSQKNSSKNADSGKSVTVKLDPTAVAALQQYNAKPSTQDADPNSKNAKNYLPDDVYVTMIVVTSTDQPQK